MKVEKIGDGEYDAEKEELVDGVYAIDGLKFGVSVFSSDKILQHNWLEGFSHYITKLVQEILNGTFATIFFVFDGKLTEDNEFNKQFTQIKSFMREDIAVKLFMISGSPEEINEYIVSTIPH